MDTLKSSAEISSIFDKGRRFHTPYFTLLVLEKQHDLYGRVAFIAGKKLGNAVWRNRAKRRMREVYRHLGGTFPSHDVVFLAKRDVATGDFETMVSQTYRKLKQANVLNDGQ